MGKISIRHKLKDIALTLQLLVLTVSFFGAPASYAQFPFDFFLDKNPNITVYTNGSRPDQLKPFNATSPRGAHIYIVASSKDYTGSPIDVTCKDDPYNSINVANFDIVTFKLGTTTILCTAKDEQS